ncbi:hypothetical protein GCM10009834_13920 [Streptomonospora arabica]
MKTAGCRHAVREQRRTTLTRTDFMPFRRRTPASPRCARPSGKPGNRACVGPRGLHPGGGWHTLEPCDECTLIGLKPTEYDVETGAGEGSADPWRRLSSP